MKKYIKKCVGCSWLKLQKNYFYINKQQYFSLQKMKTQIVNHLTGVIFDGLM